jgi:hypothetical protein
MEWWNGWSQLRMRKRDFLHLAARAFKFFSRADFLMIE